MEVTTQDVLNALTALGEKIDGYRREAQQAARDNQTLQMFTDIKNGMDRMEGKLDKAQGKIQAVKSLHTFSLFLRRKRRKSDLNFAKPRSFNTLEAKTG